MGLPPLSKIPLILRPQAWLHRRHYGEVLSPIRWWGRIDLSASRRSPLTHPKNEG